jgi:predicted DNA-binding antitoxin AbrB/MazE fold protein
MMMHMLHATAVYENGVLKLQGPLPGLANGDRVEVAIVRVALIDRDAPDEVARRERIEKEHRERTAALPPDAEDDDYDVLEAMNATRLRQGERPLIPPGEAR